MRFVLAAGIVFVSSQIALSANTVEVLQIQKGSGSSSVKILVRVSNPKTAEVDALISCVGYRGGQPVHEEEAVVPKVPPGGTAIKSIGFFTPPPIERAECRVVRY